MYVDVARPAARLKKIEKEKKVEEKKGGKYQEEALARCRRGAEKDLMDMQQDLACWRCEYTSKMRANAVINSTDSGDTCLVRRAAARFALDVVWT